MQTALITGASSGIGYELAKLFAKDKINLVLAARSGDKLIQLGDELQKKNGILVRIFAKDLGKMDAVEEIYDTLKSENIEIDYLVNNAGFGDYAFFHKADWTKLEQMIDLNVKSLTYFSKLFVDDMIKRKSGKILNLASTASFQPGPTMAVYYATKAYVLFLSEAMSNELEGTGVTVTALCPGATESGFQAAADLHESKLIKGKKLPGSAEVAAFGYKHMMKGSMTVIYGMSNYLLANSSRFAPRKWVVKIVRKIQGEKK